MLVFNKVLLLLLHFNPQFNRALPAVERWGGGGGGYLGPFMGINDPGISEAGTKRCCRRSTGIHWVVAESLKTVFKHFSLRSISRYVLKYHSGLALTQTCNAPHEH